MSHPQHKEEVPQQITDNLHILTLRVRNHFIINIHKHHIAFVFAKNSLMLQ